MKKIISISEMAEYCQVTTETIRRWIDSGAIPSSRTLGGHRRIEFRDFVRFLEQNHMPIQDSIVGKKKAVLLVGFPLEKHNALTSDLAFPDFGITVDFADSAFEAGYKTGALQPQMVIFNPTSDDMNLHAACRTIRDTADTKLTKVAVVQNDLMSTLPQEVQKLGVTQIAKLNRDAIFNLIES